MPSETEINAKLKEFDDKLGAIKKDFEIKLSTAETEVKQYKEIAEKNALALKEFEAKAKKADEERLISLKEARKADIKTFIEGAVKDARLTPAQGEIMAKLLESSNVEGVVYTFKAKDGAETNHNQFSLMKLFVSMLQPHKAFISMTPGVAPIRKETPGEQEEQHFVEIKRGGQNVTAVLDDYEMDNAAKKYIADCAAINKSVSYEEALIEVSRQSKKAA